MPLYDVKCDACGEGDTLFRKIPERDNLPRCTCGGSFFRVISAPMLAPTFSAFQSPSTGALITSRKELADDLRRAGARVYEPGMEKDIARRRVEVQEKAFAPIEAAVDSLVTAAVSAGQLET